MNQQHDFISVLLQETILLFLKDVFRRRRKKLIVKKLWWLSTKISREIFFEIRCSGGIENYFSLPAPVRYFNFCRYTSIVKHVMTYDFSTDSENNLIFDNLAITSKVRTWKHQIWSHFSPQWFRYHFLTDL